MVKRRAKLVKAAATRHRPGGCRVRAQPAHSGAQSHSRDCAGCRTARQGGPLRDSSELTRTGARPTRAAPPRVSRKSHGKSTLQIQTAVVTAPTSTSASTTTKPGQAQTNRPTRHGALRPAWPRRAASAGPRFFDWLSTPRRMHRQKTESSPPSNRPRCCAAILQHRDPRNPIPPAGIQNVKRRQRSQRVAQPRNQPMIASNPNRIPMPGM